MNTKKGVCFDSGLSSASTKEIFNSGLCHTALETGLFSNVLKGCVNKIDNIIEKDHKSWRDFEKDDLENFALV